MKASIESNIIVAKLLCPEKFPNHHPSFIEDEIGEEDESEKKEDQREKCDYEKEHEPFIRPNAFDSIK